jgi:hypothetical protein
MFYVLLFKCCFHIDLIIRHLSGAYSLKRLNACLFMLYAVFRLPRPPPPPPPLLPPQPPPLVLLATTQQSQPSRASEESPTDSFMQVADIIYHINYCYYKDK